MTDDPLDLANVSPERVREMFALLDAYAHPGPDDAILRAPDGEVLGIATRQANGSWRGHVRIDGRIWTVSRATLP